MKNRSVVGLIVGCAISLVPSIAAGQVTRTDYERAQSLRAQYEAVAVNLTDPPTWLGTTHRFWYRRTRPDGFEFVVFDADTREKQPAFDHVRLAEALSKASGETYNPTGCPSRPLPSTTR